MIDVGFVPHEAAGRGRGTLLLGLGVAALLTAAACTPVASGDSTSQPSQPTATQPASSPPPGSGDVQPRSDLANEHQVGWSRYEQVGDRAVRVHFLLRDPRCFGARADVRATSAAIEITVLEGSLPGAPDDCTLDASEASLLIETDTPVGGRSVTQP